MSIANQPLVYSGSCSGLIGSYLCAVSPSPTSFFFVYFFLFLVALRNLLNDGLTVGEVPNPQYCTGVFVSRTARHCCVLFTFILFLHRIPICALILSL